MFSIRSLLKTPFSEKVIVNHEADNEIQLMKKNTEASDYGRYGLRFEPPT